ncbi:MAG: hypothetical protein ACU0AX_02650 [Roseovarius sp.]|uniref:hypothetical protein n=1 Tax=Roseovarius sp. TaxID=1486281 RepID=UPI004058543C
MTDEPPEPPRLGVWSRAVERANADTKERAKAAGVQPVKGKPPPLGGAYVVGKSGDAPDSDDGAQGRWSLLRRAHATLRDDADANAQAAARALGAMLDSPLHRDNLMGALAAYQHHAADPVSVARANRGDTARTKEATRIAREIERLTDMAERALESADKLTLTAMNLEHLDTTPTAGQVRDDGRRAFRALLALRARAMELERHAETRGRREVPEVRARRALAVAVTKAYGAASGAGLDPVAKELFAAIWNALGKENTPRKIPDEASFWKKVSEEL